MELSLVSMLANYNGNVNYEKHSAGCRGTKTPVGLRDDCKSFLQIPPDTPVSKMSYLSLFFTHISKKSLFRNICTGIDSFASDNRFWHWFMSVSNDFTGSVGSANGKI